MSDDTNGPELGDNLDPRTSANGGEGGTGAQDQQASDQIRLMVRHELEHMGPQVLGGWFEAMMGNAITDPNGVDGKRLDFVLEAVKGAIGEDLEAGLVDKAATKAVAIAKGEMERDAEAIRARFTGSGGGGMNGAPPSNGGGGSSHGGGAEPEGEEGDAGSEAEQAQPNGQSTLGKRVVQRLKENPDIYIEKAFSYLERGLDLFDRRKNPFEALARMHEDPTGMGRAAIQMYAPDPMGDRIPTMMQRVGEMAFRAGQASKPGKEAPSWPPPARPSTSGPSTSESSSESAAVPTAEPRPAPSASATSTAASPPASDTPVAPHTATIRMTDLA